MVKIGKIWISLGDHSWVHGRVVGTSTGSVSTIFFMQPGISFDMVAYRWSDVEVQYVLKTVCFVLKTV